MLHCHFFKTHFATLLLSLFCCALKAKADSPSTHGMVVFGKSTIYASHLPMFHVPHNYQVILEISFKNEDGSTAKESYDNIQAQNSFELFTLAPERMDLTEIISGRKNVFTAELYAGHFEQNGKLLGSVSIEVKKIIFSKKLNPSAPLENKFLMFGNSDENFAVHLIGGKTSYDSIVSVTPISSNKASNSQIVEPQNMTSNASLPEGSLLYNADAAPAAQVQGSIYFNEEELAN